MRELILNTITKNQKEFNIDLSQAQMEILADAIFDTVKHQQNKELSSMQFEMIDIVSKHEL